MIEELKKCPFCGGEAVIHVNEGVRVVCTKCQATTICMSDTYIQTRPSGGAVKTVINAWNRRVNDADRD